MIKLYNDQEKLVKEMIDPLCERRRGADWEQHLNACPKYIHSKNKCGRRGRVTFKHQKQ